MLILFWNLQRPGKGNFQRCDNVLLYIQTCLETMQPDVLFLCEVPPLLFENLARIQVKGYGGVAYEHKASEKVEILSLLSSSSSSSAFTESVCSFFAFYKKTFGQEGYFNVIDEGRFWYDSAADVDDVSRGRTTKVTIQKEARPLVLFIANGLRFGVCHLVSGKAGIASQQLRHYLQLLAEIDCGLLIGDMNIKFGELARIDPFIAYDPGYATHGANSKLDYMWVNRIFGWKVTAVSMPAGLLQSLFKEKEDRLSDHAPIGYQLYSEMLHVPAKVEFPWPKRTIGTRRTRIDDDEESDGEGDSDGGGQSALIQSTLDRFMKKQKVEQLSWHEVVALFAQLEELGLGKSSSKHFDEAGFVNGLKANWKLFPIAGDGNCLFGAIAHLLYGTENEHWKVRGMAVMHMRQHADVFAHVAPNLRGYLAEMAWPARNALDRGRWGGYPEIYALSRYFRRRIVVHSPIFHGGALTTEDASPAFSPRGRDLHIYFQGGNHYEAMRPN